MLLNWRGEFFQLVLGVHIDAMVEFAVAEPPRAGGSAVIGISMRRASTTPARIATISPSAIRSAMRTSWSRIGASAWLVGCSKNTCQPSFGTGLDGRQHRMAGRIVAGGQRAPPGASAAATCGRARDILGDLGALGGARQHLAARIDHIGERGAADLGVAEEVVEKAKIDLGHRDAGVGPECESAIEMKGCWSRK